VRHRRRPRHRAFSGVTLVCSLVALLGPLHSTLHAQAAITLRVQVIYAANEPGGVDSRLGGLAAELQKTFRYSKYELLDSPQGSAALNQSWRANLPGDRRLEITPTAIQGGQYSLTVRVLSSSGQAMVNTGVRLRSGGPPALVGGLTHLKGVLIIAITVP